MTEAFSFLNDYICTSQAQYVTACHVCTSKISTFLHAKWGPVLARSLLQWGKVLHIFLHWGPVPIYFWLLEGLFSLWKFILPFAKAYYGSLTFFVKAGTGTVRLGKREALSTDEMCSHYPWYSALLVLWFPEQFWENTMYQLGDRKWHIQNLCCRFWRTSQPSACPAISTFTVASIVGLRRN